MTHPIQSATTFSTTLPQTKAGAALAVLIAIIQQETPWLRVDGIIEAHGRLYVACFDQLFHLLVSFSSETEWRLYTRITDAFPGKNEERRAEQAYHRLLGR